MDWLTAELVWTDGLVWIGRLILTDGIVSSGLDWSILVWTDCWTGLDRSRLVEWSGLAD